MRYSNFSYYTTVRPSQLQEAGEINLFSKPNNTFYDALDFFFVVVAMSSLFAKFNLKGHVMFHAEYVQVTGPLNTAIVYYRIFLNVFGNVSGYLILCLTQEDA